MFLAASDKKPLSLSIPYYAIYSFLVVVALSATYIFVNASIASSKVTKLQDAADMANKSLQQSQQLNNQLKDETQKLKSDNENKVSEFKTKVNTYEEKTKQLNKQLEEIQKQKQQILDKLSKKVGSQAYKNASLEQKENTSAKIVKLNVSENNDEISNQLSLLEAKVSTELAQFKKINAEVDKLKPLWTSTPVGLPVQGPISSEVGFRRDPFGGGSENHTGMDIRVPTGTKVKATAQGTVKFAGMNSGGYGNLVILDHGNGFETYYAHNSKVLVEVGQKVNKDDIIAESGSTGRSTGAHVHYEIRLNNVVKNPRDYMN